MEDKVSRRTLRLFLGVPFGDGFFLKGAGPAGRPLRRTNSSSSGRVGCLEGTVSVMKCCMEGSKPGRRSWFPGSYMPSRLAFHPHQSPVQASLLVWARNAFCDPLPTQGKTGTSSPSPHSGPPVGLNTPRQSTIESTSISGPCGYHLFRTADQSCFFIHSSKLVMGQSIPSWSKQSVRVSPIKVRLVDCNRSPSSGPRPSASPSHLHTQGHQSRQT